MNIISNARRSIGGTSFLFLLLLVVFSFSFPAGKAHAQTPCYAYSPASTASTISVKTYLSDGTTGNITILNQNPPSILQDMYFDAANTNCSEAYYPTDKITAEFSVPSGTIPVDGFPVLAGSYFTDSNDVVEYLPTFEYYGLGSIANTAAENAVISSVANTDKLAIQLGNSDFSNGTQTMSVPATNCVELSGPTGLSISSGSDKVVFVRGDGWNASTGDFLDQVQKIIDNGFAQKDPFRKHIGQLSFYADLANLSQSKLPILQSDPRFFDSDSDKVVKIQSSCGSSAMEYIVMFSNPNMYYAFAAVNDEVVYINVPLALKTTPSGDLPTTVIHESGHAIGNLQDEYLQAVDGSDTYDPDQLVGGPMVYTNCTDDPWSAYSYGGNMYGSVSATGCKYAFSPSAHDIYYRPTSSSSLNIMYDNLNINAEFDIISCGYVLAAIDGQPADYDHASTHWPECKGLNTVGEDDLPSVGPAPVVVTVGGGGLPFLNGIFTWVSDLLPSSIQQVQINRGLHSFAYTEQSMRDAINDALAGHHPVIVIAHSASAFLAYEISSEYLGDDVQFIYVDPPYNYPLAQLGSMSTIAAATKNASDPQLLWTNGNAMTNFRSHDPFDFESQSDLNAVAPNGQINADNLVNLADIIYSDLSTASNNVNNKYFSSESNPALSSSPSVTAVNPSSAGPGDTITLTGSFDKNGNEVYIQNTSDSDVSYTFDDIAPQSSDTTLSFALPQAFDWSGALNDTVPGTYTVEVAGSNSDFANVGTVTISPTTSATPPTMSGVNFTPSTGSGTVTGSNFSSTGNSIGLTPAPSASNIQPSSNMASAWDAFVHFIRSLFSLNKASAQTVVAPTYVIPGLTSNGTSISFQTPSSVPNGVYDVSVMSATTTWVATTYTIHVMENNQATTSPITTNPGGTNPVTTTIAGSYFVTPTAGAGGTISPSTVVSVAPGASQTFTVTPAAGYKVLSVVVNGASFSVSDIGSTTIPSSYTVTGNSTSESVKWSADNIYAIDSYMFQPTMSASIVAMFAHTSASPTISLSVSPASVISGQSSTISWTSTNADSCYIDDVNAMAAKGISWSAATIEGVTLDYGNASGTVSTGPLATSDSYTGACVGSGGTSPRRTVTVTVTPAPVTIAGTGVATTTPTYSCSSGTLSGAKCTGVTLSVAPNVVCPTVSTAKGGPVSFISSHDSGLLYETAQLYCSNPSGTISDSPKSAVCPTGYSMAYPATVNDICTSVQTVAATASCPTGFTIKGSACYSTTIAAAPTVKAGTVTSTSIPLSWTLAYNPGISYYDVILSNGTLIASTTAAAYTAKNLAPSTQYCFRVFAVKNPTYAGNASSAVCATTKAK
ncbi:MAG: hypothetical protein P4L61_01840 [Candidatus Pacebacteria bacterium]|nr:hypothetical protein [Candidatus Paceibacterota bacterium]